jgi:hypothetical protein
MLNKYLIILLISSNVVFAKTITEGTTYDIAEPNILHEIEQKSKQINWQEIQKRYKLVNTINKLPIAKEDKQFAFTPITHLPFEVKDKNGKVIYPKGFKFNALKYTTLPYKIAIVGSVKQYNQIKNKLSKADIVMVANMDTKDFIKKTKRRAFILTQNAIKNLGVKKVPSIVKQVSSSFIVSEYKVEF